MSSVLRAVATDDADHLLNAARAYADLLGLRNHTVEVVGSKPSDPSALLECTIPEGRKHILLRVRSDFRAHDRDEQRHALAHEMIHAHLIRMEEGVQRHVGSEIGGAAFRMFWRSFEADVEEIVDTFAGLLAPSLPYIEWEDV